MNWSLKHIEGLLKAKKIKGYSASKPRQEVTYREKGQVKKGSVPRCRSIGLIWLDENLGYWAKLNGFSLQQEYRFDPKRRYRMDYALIKKDLKISIEYNGGIFMEKSGHSSVSGLLRDSDKQNAAMSLGWKCIVVTPLNYKTAIETLNKLNQTS